MTVAVYIIEDFHRLPWTKQLDYDMGLLSNAGGSILGRNHKLPDANLKMFARNTTNPSNGPAIDGFIASSI